MIGLALATNQLSLSQSNLNQIENRGPQYRDYVSFLRAEEVFLSTGALPVNFPQEPFASLLKKTYQKRQSEMNLSAEFEQYFISKFGSGGFDGWSNGFVELMRAKNIANKLGLNSLEGALAKLEIQARNGQP